MNKTLFGVIFLATFLITTICGSYLPSFPRSAFFTETFQGDWESRWVHSKNEKYAGEWEVKEPTHLTGISGDKSLVVSSPAKHHGIATLFPTPLETTEDLIVQYEVKLQTSLDCGGAYLKLLTAESLPKNLEDFTNDTPYTIMFGPDKCGTESMLHFIFRHENPITHELEEKHMTKKPYIKTDKVTHLYTLHVLTNNTFTIYVDQEVVRNGSLFTEFEPPVNPPKEIDDPEDMKPEDWVDEEKIPDASDSKPSDWDEDAPPEIPDPDAKKPDTWLDNEPLEIPDPEAHKPADWVDEFDGEWEPPLIPNPKCAQFGCGEWTQPTMHNPEYKGKWKPAMIPNPAYKGKWAPKKIPNPNYFEDPNPHIFKPIGALGFELWTMTDGISFDNIIITHDKQEADDFAEKTWKEKFEIEKKKDEEEKAALASEGESYVSKFLVLLGEFGEFAVANPLVIIGTVIIGLIPVVFLSMRPSKRRQEEKIKDLVEKKEAVVKDIAENVETVEGSGTEKKKTPKQNRKRRED